MLTLFSNHKFCQKIHGSNYLSNLSVTMIFAVLLLTILTISCASNVDGIQNLENSPIGDQPTLDKHVSQISIDSGNVELDRLIEHGSLLFSAQFNSLDGAGRPETTGVGDSPFRSPRVMPDNFNRISGPDANACVACHNVPIVGGGGDNVTNVFVDSEVHPFVNFDGGEGNSFSDQSIPSLESVLKLADEKIYLDLDVKSLELLGKTSKLVAKMGMQGQAAIKTQVQTYEQAENLKELESKIGVMVMPMMHFSSDDFLEKFDLLQSVSPAMVEAEFDDLSTLSSNQNYFKNAGISIWVNTLDPVACCEFNDSSALIDPDSIWGELIRAGVSIIQTDEPEALKKFLSSHVFTDG